MYEELDNGIKKKKLEKRKTVKNMNFLFYFITFYFIIFSSFIVAAPKFLFFVIKRNENS